MTDNCDEVTFVEELLDIHHECLVCLQLLREPWIIECCGHHLCKPCIDKLTRSKSGCPHCRKLKFRYMRDRNLERILLGKQVYCKYKSKGCEWQGTLREADHHCSSELPCEWCESKLLCYELEGHNEACFVANEITDCELQPFGCPITFPRKNKKIHMQSNCYAHVKLLKQAYQDLSLEVVALQHQNDELREEKAVMTEDMSTKLKQVKEEYESVIYALQECLNGVVDMNKQIAGEYSEFRKETEAFKENVRQNIEELTVNMKKAIIDNSDTTLLGHIHDLSEEKEEIMEKLSNSQAEVKLLHTRVRRYKFAAVIAFLVALVIGIILQYCIPKFFDVVIQLLVLTFIIGCPALVVHKAAF